MKRNECMRKIIIFTDLDGTLLDSHTYSFRDALPSIQLLREKDIPLVICSSKTRAEIEYYRRNLKNQHPFISENGGGIFIPKGYFKSNSSDLKFRIVRGRKYDTVILGSPYKDLSTMIQELRKQGYPVKGFGDMTAEEVAALTNLSIHEAMMAKERDFDEPFLFEGDDAEIQRLSKVIRSKGFTITRGRFFHILGNSDKGMTVSILSELYKKQFGEILTVAVGDSPNDLPMLKKVDKPVIVQKPDGSYDPQLNLPGIIKADDIGPRGWDKAIVKLLSAFRPSG
jgi:mannosyl-3-phosphoglycerate phosphatase